MLYTLAALASVLIDRGDTERATRLVEAIEVPPATNEMHLSWIHSALGRVAAAAGDDEAAVASFEIARDIYRAVPGDADAIWQYGSADRIACYLRLRPSRRSPYRRRANPRDRAQGRSSWDWRASRCACAGSSTPTARTSRHRWPVLQRTPMRLEHASALLELGAHLRRAGERSAARDPLRRALGLAHACGAMPLAERARDELLLAGARPRRDAQVGRDALTAAELRVARLAADGLTNREIAQQLFITIKTVEGHLARTFRKLDVHRRDDLTSAMQTAPPDAEP